MFRESLRQRPSQKSGILEAPCRFPEFGGRKGKGSRTWSVIKIFCIVTLWPPSHTGVNPDWLDRRLPVDDRKLWFYPRAPAIFKSVGRRMVQMRYVLEHSHNSCALGYPVGVFHVDTWAPGPILILLVVLFVLIFVSTRTFKTKNKAKIASAILNSAKIRLHI